MLVLWVSAGIMGPHTTFIPKICKLDVLLWYMQVPLSTNFPIKTCLLWVVFKGLMISGVPQYEPWTVYVDIHTIVYWKVLWLRKMTIRTRKARLYNARIQFKLQLKNASVDKAPGDSKYRQMACSTHKSDLQRFFCLEPLFRGGNINCIL